MDDLERIDQAMAAAVLRQKEGMDISDIIPLFIAEIADISEAPEFDTRNILEELNGGTN
jgi:antitoxin component of RelBE/YafQ-DinJ toxin-antitoxin module